MVRKNPSANSKSAPNPYLMALLTATLAGLFSVFGSYFTASFQAKNAVTQKQLEYRAQAYATFLEKIDRSRAPIFAELLNLGSLSEHATTDSEIQALEDHSAVLLKKANLQDVYWQLNSDFNILRLYGTPPIQQSCEDILKLLALRDREVKWSAYPKPLQEYYERWRKAQDQGRAYGWEEKVSGDERLMIVIVSKLFGVLVGQLRDELRNVSPA